MRKIRIAATIALSASLLGSVQAAVATEEPLPGSSAAASEADVQEALVFREAFGLRSDLAYVRASLRDPLNFSSEAYGVPLSQPEVDEMFRRSRIQTAMDDVVAFARSRPGFAGAYLDQQEGGRPVLMFTAPNVAWESAIAALLPADADAQVLSALRTEEELARLKTRIGDARSQWADRGVDVIRVAIMTSDNTVRIGVLDRSTEAVRALRDAYGDHVLVEETKVANSDVCDAWNNCRFIKGGIAINQSGASEPQCTAGFVVQRTDTAALALLTAGHCIQAHGGFDAAWQHNFDGFGRALRETWEPGGVGDADVGLITIVSSEVALMTSKNQMRRTNGSVASVTSYQLNTLQGSQACRVGKSGHKCGAVKSPDVEHLSPVPGVGTMRVLHTAEVSAFDAINGDSGGPIFSYPGGGTCCSPVRAMGTHVHSLETADQLNWFSPYWVGRTDYDAIPDNLAAYTYDICLSASC